MVLCSGLCQFYSARQTLADVLGLYEGAPSHPRVGRPDDALLGLQALASCGFAVLLDAFVRE